MLFQFYRLMTTVDNAIDHRLHPWFCRFCVWLFDHLTEAQQVAENEYYTQRKLHDVEL